VPTEPLSEIFKLSLSLQGEGVAVSEASPWALGRFSAKWRTMALDMHCLWTSVFIPIPYRASGDLARSSPLGIILEYLERSRNT
jgi:hypothetical protein